MGEIGLPDIQRPFVWKNAKVRDLFDSMYQGYPVGYLLFWETDAEKGVKQIGSNNHQKAPHLLIVDGQQRLTSLFAVLKGISVIREDYNSEKIEIAFKPLEGKFEVADASIRRNPEWIPNISTCFSRDASQFGMLAAFYYYGYSGMQIPVAILLDRFSARYVVFLFAVLCGLATLMFTYTTNFYLAIFSKTTEHIS